MNKRDMKKLLILSLLAIWIIGCKNQVTFKNTSDDLTTFLTYDPLIQNTFQFYSEIVNDTYNIFVSTPKDYEKSDNSYPVVYVLDANVAFDMVATLMKLLSNGLDCRYAIYVGIGYKDIMLMDSLRGRDYSFPHDNEFPGSGGGDNFSMFLQKELIPDMNSKYRTINGENTIIGHSASGYFVIYNLLSSAIENQLVFKNFIAGSPFITNDQYLLDLESQLSATTDSLPVNLFMCSGTIEDTDSMQILFSKLLEQRNYKGLGLKSIILNDFDHMDALIPTWSKGLRFALKYE